MWTKRTEAIGWTAVLLAFVYFLVPNVMARSVLGDLCVLMLALMLHSLLDERLGELKTRLKTLERSLWGDAVNGGGKDGEEN